jgi:hypothetical protein
MVLFGAAAIIGAFFAPKLNAQGIPPPAEATVAQVAAKTAGNVYVSPRRLPSGGSGTVTSVSVVSANGVSGTVANQTTTPAITLSVASNVQTVAQTSNGFTLGECVYNDGTGTVGSPHFSAADNSAQGTATVAGVVTVTGTNSFTMTTSGYESTITGLAANTVYYLGTGGALTATAPTGTTSFVTPVLKTGAAGDGTVQIGAAASNALISPASLNVGTGVANALGVNVGSPGAFVTYNGALGTPSSGTLTNATGLPAASVVAGALSNGMTATTQSAASNDTKLATDAYVDALAAATLTLTNKNLTSGTNTFPTFNQNTTGSAGSLAANATIATPTSGSSTVLAGYIGMPQNSQSAAYTMVLGDMGKHILHPTADNNARTFTIDSNANVAWPIGTVITVVNQINTVTIAITSDTLTWYAGSGTGSTGSRSLAAGGVATLLKVGTTSWIISGPGVS